MKIFATITAVDTPTTGFYKARTNFGTNVSGVSLRATPLAEDEEVAVFEVEGAFGAFAEYGSAASLLTIPGSYRAGIYTQNPANTALAYLGLLANNKRNYYEVGTVAAIVDDKLTVSGKISGTLKTDGVDAVDFTIGDEVLIRTYPGNAVIGWWNTFPNITGIPAIKIARVRASSSVKMELWESYRNGQQKLLNSVLLSKFPLTEFVDSAFVQTLRTDDTEEYFYSYVYMFRNFGGAYEEHYVRWHKVNFTVEEITSTEYNIEKAAQPAFTKTANDKFWWWSYPTPPSGTTDNEYAYISDEEAGAKSKTFFADEMETDGAWWPKQGYDYEVWV